MNDLSHLSKVSKLMQNIERRRTLQTLLYSGFFSKINCNLFWMEQTKFERSENQLYEQSKWNSGKCCLGICWTSKKKIKHFAPSTLRSSITPLCHNAMNLNFHTKSQSLNWRTWNPWMFASSALRASVAPLCKNTLYLNFHAKSLI